MINASDSICNRAVRLVGASIVVFGLASAPALGDEAPISKPFNLTAKIHSEPSHRLELTLTNTSEEPLRFFHGVLSRAAVSLVLVQDRAYGDVLDEWGVLDNPSLGEITLNPNASHSHFINLNESFPSLSSELQKRDLVLFWTAVISTSDAGDAAIRIRFGGYLLIPSGAQI